MTKEEKELLMETAKLVLIHERMRLKDTAENTKGQLSPDDYLGWYEDTMIYQNKIRQAKGAWGTRGEKMVIKIYEVETGEVVASYSVIKEVTHD